MQHSKMSDRHWLFGKSRVTREQSRFLNSQLTLTTGGSNTFSSLEATRFTTRRADWLRTKKKSPSGVVGAAKRGPRDCPARLSAGCDISIEPMAHPRAAFPGTRAT